MEGFRNIEIKNIRGVDFWDYIPLVRDAYKSNTERIRKDYNMVAELSLQEE